MTQTNATQSGSEGRVDSPLRHYLNPCVSTIMVNQTVSESLAFGLDEFLRGVQHRRYLSNELFSQFLVLQF